MNNRTEAKLTDLSGMQKGELYKKGYEDAKKEFEPKLADWRLVPNSNGDRYCTNCRTIVDFYSQKNYCLYCGAKMIAFETPNGLMLRTDETSYTYLERREKE